MYCAHFGLHRPPFNNTPDPAFYFGTPEHEEALATLEYATTQRKGFVLVTGEIGAGKTLIGRMFLRRIEPRARTAIITHTHLNGRQLLAAICHEFELVVPPEASNLQLAERLQSFLLEQFARDVFVVVLLDEAQNLPDESFEAVRMLGNLEADDAKLVQVCILGQPELRERFLQPGMRQLDQRLFRRFHLSTLTREQTGQYIAHRLKVAGHSGGELFTPQAIDRIHVLGGGTPRLINRICDNALLTVYGRGGRVVDAEVIEEVAGAPAPVLAPTIPGEAGLHTAPRLPVRSAGAPAAAVKNTTGPAIDAQAIGRLAQRLDRNESELRALGREAAHRFQRLTEGLKQLEKNAASAADLERVRTECRAAVADLLRGFEGQSSALSRLQNEIDGTATTAAGGRQAALDALHERFEAQVRELHQLYDQVSRGRAGIEERLEALAAQATGQHEQIRELDTRLAEQGRGVEALEQRINEELEAVERGLSSILENAATHEDLDRVATEQQAAVESLRRTQSEALLSLAQRQENAVAQLEKQQAAALRVLQERVESVQARSGGSESDLESLRGRQQADLERLRAEQRAELEALRAQQRADMEALSARQRAEMDNLRGEQQAGMSALRAEQAEALAELSRRQVAAGESQRRQADALDHVKAGLAHQGQKVDDLGRRVTGRLDDLERELEHLQATAAEVETLERWKGEQAAAIDDLGRRLDEAARSLDRVRKEIEARSASLADEQRAAADKLQGRLLDQLRRVRGLRQRFDQWRQDLNARIEGLAGTQHEQGRTIESLGASLAERQRELLALDQRVAARFEEVDQGLRTHREQAASREEVERLRGEYGTALAEVSERLTREAEALRLLDERVQAESAAATGENRRRFDELSARVAEQAGRVRGLHRRLLKWQGVVENQFKQLEGRFADRGEFEEFRAAARDEAAEVRARFERHGQAMDALIEGVVQRCRKVQEQLDTVAGAKADVQQVAQLAERQARDAVDLLARLEGHRQTVREQMEQAFAQWERTQSELSRLAATSAPAEELAALRERQGRDTAQLLDALTAQRGELESLLAGVNRRCDDICDRLAALPPNPVDSGQLDALRTEHAEQIRVVCARIEDGESELNGALRQLSDRCRQLETGIQDLAARAASAEDVEQLRAAHARELDAIVDRLDAGESAHQREVLELNQRWEDLAVNVRALAASVTPTSTILELEQTVTGNLSELRERIDAAQRREREQMRSLSAAIQQLACRVGALENLERPKPVMLELNVEAGRQLAELSQQARAEREQLTEAARRLESARTALDETARRVEQALAGWRSGAAAVEQRAGELAASTRSAGELLGTMQKAQKILDDKIHSQRWQAELVRGETLTGRLDAVIREGSAICVRLHAALRDFDRCREEAEAWSARRDEARQITANLAALLTKGQRAGERFEAEIDRRRRALAALAKNTAGLVNVIEEARLADQGIPARRRHHAEPPEELVTQVQWPRLHAGEGRTGSRATVNIPTPTPV